MWTASEELINIIINILFKKITDFSEMTHVYKNLEC